MSTDERKTGPRVLVVEDEYYVADDLTRCLIEYGAVVLGPIATLEEGLAFVNATHEIDAAIVDVNLHGQSGLKIAEVLMARQTPVFLSTGYDGFAFPERFHKLPRWQKPFSPIRLIEALFAALARA